MNVLWGGVVCVQVCVGGGVDPVKSGRSLCGSTLWNEGLTMNK